MTYNIIQHKGQPKKATTLKNVTVNRAESLFIQEWGTFIKCAPYDDHFIYESKEPGQSAYMCTCGAVAVVVPPGPQGMFVCYHHATYGFHTTSMVNKKDIERGNVKIMKGKKWV